MSPGPPKGRKLSAEGMNEAHRTMAHQLFNTRRRSQPRCDHIGHESRMLYDSGLRSRSWRIAPFTFHHSYLYHSPRAYREAGFNNSRVSPFMIISWCLSSVQSRQTGALTVSSFSFSVGNSDYRPVLRHIHHLPSSSSKGRSVIR